jgi:hypothetical protein
LPKAKPAAMTHAYTFEEITRMVELLPEPARVVVAVAAFTGLRKGELRGLEVTDYSAGVLTVRQSVWKKHIGAPKGKRGQGAVPVIPWIAHIMDSYIQAFGPRKYLFESFKGGPIDLDYMVCEVIIPDAQGQVGCMAWLARVSPGPCYQSPSAWSGGHRYSGHSSPQRRRRHARGIHQT